MDNKRIEQLCQSDMVNTRNIIHIIEAIESEILEHHFKYSFYNNLINSDVCIEYNKEVQRVLNIMKEKEHDSFMALLIIQGKEDNELDELIKNMIEWRYKALVDQGSISFKIKDGQLYTAMEFIGSNELSFINHILISEKSNEITGGMGSMMQGLMESFGSMGKEFGVKTPSVDFLSLMKDENGKIDLSKLMDKEKREEKKD